MPKVDASCAESPSPPPPSQSFATAGDDSNEHPAAYLGFTAAHDWDCTAAAGSGVPCEPRHPQPRCCHSHRRRG